MVLVCGFVEALGFSHIVPVKDPMGRAEELGCFKNHFHYMLVALHASGLDWIWV
tara:strand:+ start:1744 stop:1905 length:162 start_codon:yes stop_codon:yes gene_type:complete